MYRNQLHPVEGLNELFRSYLLKGNRRKWMSFRMPLDTTGFVRILPTEEYSPKIGFKQRITNIMVRHIFNQVHFVLCL